MNRRLLRSLLAVSLLAFLSSCGGSSPTAPGGNLPIPPDLIEGEVAATLLPGVSPRAVADDYGARVLAWEGGEWCALFAPPAGQTAAQFALTLVSDSRVVTSEQNGWIEPAESRQQSFAFDDGQGTPQTYAEQSAGRALGLNVAHTVSTGSGVIVAVLDTGIDPAHPAFTGRLVAGRDFVGDDADPTDVTNGVDDDRDGQTDEAWGHGSHVAGIVALTAPGASIMPVRVLDADGRGNVVTVAAGIRWAVSHGAQVLNLSLGTLKSSDMIQNALDDAESAGIIVVASAGNWGSDRPQEYPATSSHATAVAACDTLARPAPFTSYGSWVDLCAPGIGIRSAFPGGGYRLWSGTSMSAPFVAGAAALVRSRFTTLSARDVMQRLEDTSRPIRGASNQQSGKLGAGMIDAGAAVIATSPSVATR